MAKLTFFVISSVRTVRLFFIDTLRNTGKVFVCKKANELAWKAQNLPMGGGPGTRYIAIVDSEARVGNELADAYIRRTFPEIKVVPIPENIMARADNYCEARGLMDTDDEKYLVDRTAQLKVERDQNFKDALKAAKQASINNYRNMKESERQLLELKAKKIRELFSLMDRFFNPADRSIRRAILEESGFVFKMIYNRKPEISNFLGLLRAARRRRRDAMAA